MAKHKIAVTSMDLRAIQCMAKCGKLTESQSRRYIGTGKGRLDKLVKAGLLERKNTTDHLGRGYQHYELSQRGQVYAKEMLPNVIHLYKGCSYLHDISLAEAYLSKLTIEQQNMALTEQDQRDYFGSYYGDRTVSTLDMYVPKIEINTETGVEISEEILLEIATGNYSQSDLLAKSSYGEEVIQTSTAVTFIYAKY